jgi:hypothetical protein
VWLEETLGNELAGYSLQEIDVALKMNVMGEFEPTREFPNGSVEAYNMFNIKFLAGVIKQYRKFRVQADKEYTELRYKTEKPAQIELSEAQKDLITAEGVLGDFRNMLDGYELFGLATKYDFLIKIGALVVPPDSLEEMINRAKEVIERQATTSTNKTQRKWLRSRMMDPESLRVTTENTAKEMIVAELFNEFTKDTPSVDEMYYNFMMYLKKHLLDLHPHIFPISPTT